MSIDEKMRSMIAGEDAAELSGETPSEVEGYGSGKASKSISV